MLQGEKQVTKGGNPKTAPIAVYLQWIVEAWVSISKELIVESFKSCGVSNAIDGNENDAIHRFKEVGPVPSGRGKLKLARDEKKLAGLIQEIDLEEEQENVFNDSDMSLGC